MQQKQTRPKRPVSTGNLWRTPSAPLRDSLDVAIVMRDLRDLWQARVQEALDLLPGQTDPELRA
jgi:hypothetical protein